MLGRLLPRQGSEGARPGRLWRLALGPLVLLLIVLSLDLHELSRAFASARLTVLGPAFVVVLPAIGLRAMRWWWLLGPAGRRAGFVRLVQVYAYAVFVGSVTPGRVGEFIKVAEASRLGMSYGMAFATVAVDRLYDIFMLLVLGALALAWRVLPGADSSLAYVILTASVLLGVGAWLGVRAERFGRARAALLGLVPTRFREPIKVMGADARAAIVGLTLSRALVAAGLTVAVWTITYYGNYLAAESLRLGIGFAEMAGISALCSLVALLPISILGAGTRDATLIAILAGYGASAAQAVALSTMFLALTLWTGLVCGLGGMRYRPP